jgi:hypothetical protein
MVVSATVSFKEKEIWCDFTNVWVSNVQRTAHMFLVMDEKDEFGDPIESVWFLQKIKILK